MALQWQRALQVQQAVAVQAAWSLALPRQSQQEITPLLWGLVAQQGHLYSHQRVVGAIVHLPLMSQSGVVAVEITTRLVHQAALVRVAQKTALLLEAQLKIHILALLVLLAMVMLGAQVDHTHQVGQAVVAVLAVLVRRQMVVQRQAVQVLQTISAQAPT